MDSDRIVIRGAAPLRGEVVVPGAKNSVLKLMAATLLADGVYHLSNVPAIDDVVIMSELLTAIGVSTAFEGNGNITMTNHGDITPVAPYELVERIRASINVLGPLLGRCGRVTLSLPGGDDFGSRPIDMHVKGLEAMGATFELQHGYVEAVADRLRGADITLEFPSVGATENILTAAVHAKGTTVIDNAAREPEIADLCAMLTSMGADIEGAGSSTLVVHGVEPGSLRGGRRPNSGSDVPRRGCRVWGRSGAARCATRPHGDARPAHHRHGCHGHVGGRRSSRVGARSASFDRRRDTAVSRHRDRLQAHARGAGRL